MGWFGKKKKIVDLSNAYRAPVKNVPVRQGETENTDMNFLNDMASASDSSSGNVVWDSDNSQKQDYTKEKKIKLTKRLLDMTEKIEDLSNQIYHIKQRMEVIEKKLKISFE